MKSVLFLILSSVCSSATVLAAGSIQTASSSEQRLECRAGAFGIESLALLSDKSDSLGQIHIQYSNGVNEVKKVLLKDINNLESEDLWIANDSELNLSLKKHSEKYFLKITGDGYNQTKEISCNKN